MRVISLFDRDYQRRRGRGNHEPRRCFQAEGYQPHLAYDLVGASHVRQCRIVGGCP